MDVSTSARHRNRIREIRRSLGLSAKKLAERVDTTEATISRIECGKQGLNQVWIEKIAAALEVRAADLLEDRPCAIVDRQPAWNNVPSTIEDYRQRLCSGGSLSPKETMALLDDAEQLSLIAANLAFSICMAAHLQAGSSGTSELTRENLIIQCEAASRILSEYANAGGTPVGLAIAQCQHSAARLKTELASDGVKSGCGDAA